MRISFRHSTFPCVVYHDILQEALRSRHNLTRILRGIIPITKLFLEIVGVDG